MSMYKPPVSPQRIAFEAWYRDNDSGANLVRTGKGYIDSTTRVAWRAWQAAQKNGEPAAWVYPEFFEGIARAGSWTAYAGDGVGQNPDGVVRIPLYRGPQRVAFVQEPVALPLHETEEMHDAVMSVLYQGVSRTNTDALWQAYRKVLATTPPAAQPAVPEGYALIGIDVLKAWGKYDEVSAACCYPLGAKQKGGA